jgi:hypothetical protein
MLVPEKEVHPMFGIPSNSGYTTVSAHAANVAGRANSPKSPKPTFGLTTTSFHGQAPQVRPMTPKMEQHQSVGRRLDFFA